MLRVEGEPGRLDRTVVDTFRAMMNDTPTRPGYTGTQCLLADEAAATLVIIAVFESRDYVALLHERIRAVLAVAAELMGGDPQRMTVDVLDVADVPGTPAALYA